MSLIHWRNQSKILHLLKVQIILNCFTHTFHFLHLTMVVLSQNRYIHDYPLDFLFQKYIQAVQKAVAEFFIVHHCQDVIQSCLTLVAFRTVLRPLLHFCTRFPPTISSTVSLCLSPPLVPSLLCACDSPFFLTLSICFCLHLHSLLSSLSTSFHKVARTPVLCGFWVL